MRSEFAMSSAELVEEAAEWLEGLGCSAQRGPDPIHTRLVVFHDEDLQGEVARIVMIVDPASSVIEA
jgi:hypothetical protein